MASRSAQREMINKFISALREQGFLDENFNNLTNLYENENPLATFCNDAEPKLKKAEKQLTRESLDFPSVVSMMEQIKANAAMVGGKRVAEACAELEERCKASDIEGSNEVYKKVIWEYYILRDTFHHILQAERSIHYQMAE